MPIKPYCSGIGIYTPSGVPLILRGFNFNASSWLPFSESDIAWIASKGYNSVRLWMTWASMQSSATAAINWTYVDQVVSWCQKYNIWALITFGMWHFSSYFNYTKSDGSAYGAGVGVPPWLVSAGGYPNSAAGVTAFADDWYQKRGYGATTWAKFVAFWQQVVTRYKDVPNIWAYEVINEPLVGGSFSPENLWLDPSSIYIRYKELIAIIRAIDPATIIVCHDVFYGSQSTFVGNCQRIISEQGYLPPNTCWTRSEYLMYEGGSGQITSRQNTIHAGVNDLLGIPYIVSETGLRSPAEYPNDIANYGQGMIDLDNKFRTILNANQSGAIHYYQYAKGVRGGFQGPRNSDGSDSDVQPILVTWLAEGVTLFGVRYTLVYSSNPTGVQATVNDIPIGSGQTVAFLENSIINLQVPVRVDI